jgi:gliding motility-associated-like protein
MKRLLTLFSFVLFFFGETHAQCGQTESCFANNGINSTDDAATIAYDNMGSTFHASYIKEPDGIWKVWGANLQNNGNQPIVYPAVVNNSLYPALTGTIYKMGLGGNSQLIVLTSTGLFVVGNEEEVLNGTLTTSAEFQKITVNGKADGLPENITPEDVKMLFVTNGMIIITTCAGTVYVLSQNVSVNGSGEDNDTDGLAWSQVLQDADTPLTDVIVARGGPYSPFALKSDGTLWTWGPSILGDGQQGPSVTRYYATQMVQPAGIPGIKMIQKSTGGSYYVLGTDKKIYVLGGNIAGQLGDNTQTRRLVWVNSKNPDDSIIDDAAWISANEHDNAYPSFSVIKTNGHFFSAGSNSYGMTGRTDLNVNFLNFPQGITSSDVITFAETGGHSIAAIKLGSARYGYVGHRILGSMGEGTSIASTQYAFDFNTPPVITVCGTTCVQPQLANNGPICSGSDAVFTITGTPGDTVDYNINAAATQTATIGASGSVAITVANAQQNQTLQLTHVFGGASICSDNLSLASVVAVNPLLEPIFLPVQSICQGSTINPLPAQSDNGVAGSWSPAFNNQQTTTYTFTPTSSGCWQQTTLTVVVVPPLVPEFTQPAAICAGSPINPLPLVSENGLVGTWTPAFDNLATTTYTFVPQDESCTARVSLTIIVNPIQLPVFNQVVPMCEGSLFAQLPAVSINGIAGTWSPSVNNMVTTTYTFTPQSGLCASSVSMTVVVNPKIAPSFAPIASACFGSGTIVLPTQSIENITGTWSPTINNTATTTYTFTPHNGQCANPSTMTVAVFDDFDYRYKSYCAGENYLVEFEFDGLDIDTRWEQNGRFVSSDNPFNLTAYLNATATTPDLPMAFEVTLTDANQCEKTQSIAIDNIHCGIQKGISPNGDAKNDFFDLRLLNAKSLSIFNRYGLKVYHKNGYNDEWRGQADDGKTLPDGTYYYVIGMESGPSKTGWIYLNKQE